MDHAIYTAMGAARQTLEQQSITANNLANASTPGFRAQLAALRAVPVDGPSLATRTLVTASTPGADMSQGAELHRASAGCGAAAGRFPGGEPAGRR